MSRGTKADNYKTIVQIIGGIGLSINEKRKNSYPEHGMDDNEMFLAEYTYDDLHINLIH